MGDARAETYLRLLAEAELRRAAGQLRGLDAGVATDDGSDPGVSPFAVLERALWKVGQAGRILVAADALDEDFLACLAADLYAATKVRSRIILDSDRVRGRLRAALTPSSGQPPPSHGSVRAMRVTPIGRAFPVASDRAPSTLHLMSLVRTRTEAVITVVMRMHWPSDGSSTDLEITGAGPHHLPYDELRAVDDQGTRYAVRRGSPWPG